MGCLLSCFRAGPDRSGDLRDPRVRDSRLGEAFLDGETKFEANGRLEEDAVNGGAVEDELLREANYLQSCGTISRIPPEIIEGSTPISTEDTNECTNVPSMKETALLDENLSEVFDSDEHDILNNELNIEEGSSRVESELRSSLNSDEHDQNIDDKPSFEKVRSQSADSSDSPYPTPLVLRGDVQTPGTVYTAYKETSRAGKRARASRQFIYPVLRPIENKLQWMELKVESPVISSNPPKRLCADFTENSHQISARSTATQKESSESSSFALHDNSEAQDEFISPHEANGQDRSQKLLEGGQRLDQNSEHGKQGISSLSYWLKPSSADGDSHSDAEGNLGFEEKAFDVPIFPAFCLNWEDNPTPVLPKPWDGNGIPNTTTKYKEDQKVSWHATPFEERLLKVLSDENPRNIGGELIHLEENAE